MSIKILVVDDDIAIVTVLRTLLQREGYEVTTMTDSANGLTAIQEGEFDIVLSDIVMKPLDGISLLQQVMEQRQDLPMIMMTGHATVETAIQAMKLGAFDYICKPFNIEELLSTVQRATSYNEAREQQQDMPPPGTHFETLVGNSPKMRHVYDLTNRVAAENTILILGESGTGKSQLAKALHRAGPHADGPFIYINCMEYPEQMLEAELFGAKASEDGGANKPLGVTMKGAIELAEGGTLYLDEIGGLSTALQERLAALIKKSTKNGSLPTRLIISVTEALERKVKRGEILSELYYALNVTAIELPPLRDRSDDISLLIQHFIHMYNQNSPEHITIDSKALRAMENYSWPGNVRELQNSVVRSATTCESGAIKLEHLPGPVRACYKRASSSIFGYSDEFDLRWWSLKQFLKNKEKDYVTKVMELAKGDRAKAAQMLGISVEVFNQKYAENGNQT